MIASVGLAISVIGGAGDSTVDLSAVTASTFTFPGIQVSVNAGEGAKTHSVVWPDFVFWKLK